MNGKLLMISKGSGLDPVKVFLLLLKHGEGS
jgi:hypothetical protein